MKLYIYVIKIIFAILISLGIGYFVYPYLKEGVLEVKELSLVLAGIFVFGLCFDLIRLISINNKDNWISGYKLQRKAVSSSMGRTPKMFEEIAKKFAMTDDKKKLTLEEYYNAVKSLDVCFSHNKDAGRFFVKLCFMAGFLVAFLCIIMALGNIANMFTSINLDLTDSVGALSDLQSKLSGPLKELTTSFSLVFLGIYLSCLLSYIDRQIFIAENKFLVYAENWLLSCTNQNSN